MTEVIVYWKDITAYGDRTPLGEAMKAELTNSETRGLLIYEGEDQVIVAHNLFRVPKIPEPYVSEYTVIPKGCIYKIDKLEFGTFSSESATVG